jgi:hypothetical protein
MPRILSRRTGRELGVLDEHEYAQLMALFAASADGQAPAPVGPDAVARLAGSGASARLLAVVRQILQDREDFEVDWEQDAD